MDKTKQNIENRIADVMQKVSIVLPNHPVVKAGLFGSVLTDEFKPKKSDIDLGVIMDYPKGYSLWDYAGLALELEKVLQEKVDLVDINQIKPILKPYILPTIKYFYEKD